MKAYQLKPRIQILVESKLRRFKSWIQYGNPRFPEGIAIETGTFCNRTCDHCANSTLKAKNQVLMSDRIFTILMDRICEMGWTGTCSFNFFDEPLLNPKLIDRVAEARNRLPKNRLVCYTNGDFLTLEKMAAFVNAGLSEMWISDHNNKKTRPHEVKEGWQEKICAIEKAFPNNVVLRGVIDYKPWLVNMGGYAKPLTSPKRERCESVYGWFMVLYNGDVNLCSCEPSRRFIQGNIVETPILKIWKESKIFALREGAGRGRAPMLKECIVCLAGNTEYIEIADQERQDPDYYIVQDVQ